jgi:hypothetical protein
VNELQREHDMLLTAIIEPFEVDDVKDAVT